MTYVLYRKSDTFAVRKDYGGIKYFATAGAAKSYLTRKAKKAEAAFRANKPKWHWEDFLNKADWAVAERDEFHSKIERAVVRKNLLTGKEFTESFNTPNFLSPASEAYWSS